MKLLVVCLTVFVALSFAIDMQSLDQHSSGGSGYTPGGTDATLFAQTYVYDDVKSGWRHGAICDDFILDYDGTADAARFWMIYTGGTTPIDYELTIAQDTGDSDPNNASIVWMETCPAVLFDTGDLIFSIDAICWQVDCAFATPLSLTAGDRYWFMITCHDDTVYDYMVLRDFDAGLGFGSMAWSYDGATWWRGDDSTHSFGSRRDMFFDIYGVFVALQNETWGSIKAIF